MLGGIDGAAGLPPKSVAVTTQAVGPQVAAGGPSDTVVGMSLQVSVGDHVGQAPGLHSLSPIRINEILDHHPINHVPHGEDRSLANTRREAFLSDSVTWQLFVLPDHPNQVVNQHVLCASIDIHFQSVSTEEHIEAANAGTIVDRNTEVYRANLDLAVKECGSLFD